MSFVSVLIAAVAGYGVATAIQKGKTKEIETLLITKEEKKKELEYRPSKPEHEKDVLDIMEDMIHRGEFSKFTLVERKNEKSKYHYLHPNDILFTIAVDEEYIQCQVKRKGTPVLEYIYDHGWEVYDKDVAYRSLLEERNQEEAMSIIEDFKREVNNYEWNKVESGIEIVDDVKEIKPVTFETAHQTTEAPLALDGFSEMEKMEKIIQQENLNDDVSKKVLGIIEKIKKATEEMKVLDKELDIEAKHVYDELIKKDLSKLFHAYLKLDEENREEYKQKILDGLLRIESKISDILELIENKNLNQIDAIIDVIKQRYKE